MVTTMPREPVAGCFSQVKGAMRGAGEFILILFCRTAAAGADHPDRSHAPRKEHRCRTELIVARHACSGGHRSVLSRFHHGASVLGLRAVPLREPADGMSHYDLIIRGGRVLDPETKLDATADVAVK
ncbi:MAG: hypothetical protein E7A86_37570, partial [Bradyrhizobium sp.]|nr:hypothetical protein [Bradyrhizobium sp.]